MFEISHPARVHAYRRLIERLRSNGFEVICLVTEKDLTVHLMDGYGIEYRLIGRNRNTFLGKALEQIRSIVVGIIQVARFKPVMLVGGASLVLGIPAILFRIHYLSISDTEHASLTWALTERLISHIVTPSMYKRDHGAKHTRLDTFKELAYLHADSFKPDPSVLEKLDLKPDSFILMRLISWSAQHDRGQQGFSRSHLISTVRQLEQYGRVLISSEEELPDELRPNAVDIDPIHIHSVLYYASLYFGESGTMATESAVLGTPAVRVSSLARKLGNSVELNKKYGLLHYYEEESEAMRKSIEILQSPTSKTDYKNKAELLMREKVDLSDYLFKYILNIVSKNG